MEENYLTFHVNGETRKFRDERMFVMNLAYGIVQKQYVDENNFIKNGKEERTLILSTYYNTPNLEPFRQDKCESFEEAKQYIIKQEPTVPIITNDGKALELFGSVEEIYNQWLIWLEERGLLPTLSLFQHVPENSFFYNQLNSDIYPTFDDGKVRITELQR